MITDIEVPSILPLGLFLALSIVFYKDPFYGIIGILFERTILRDGLQLEFFSPLFNLNQFTLYEVILFSLVIAVALHYFKDPHIHKVNSATLKCLLILGILVIFSFLRGVVQHGKLAYVSYEYMLMPMVIFPCVLHKETKESNIHRLFNVVKILSAVAIIIAVLKYFGFVSFAPSEIDDYYAMRVIDRSTIMMLVFCVIIFVITYLNNISSSSFYFAFLLTIIVAIIIATNLRSGWIALVTMMIYCLIKMPKRFMRLAIPMLLGICVLILSLLLIKPDLAAKIKLAIEESYFAPTDASTSTFVFREMLNAAYFNNMTTSGFIIGMPAAELPSIPVKVVTGEANDTIGLHNQYMSYLYYTGILGLITFLILNLTIVKRLYASCRLIPERKDYYEILMVGIIVYIPFSYANTFDPLYPILMALGTSFATIQNPSNKVMYLSNKVNILS